MGWGHVSRYHGSRYYVPDPWDDVVQLLIYYVEVVHHNGLLYR